MDDIEWAERALQALRDRKAAFDANLQMNECPGCGSYRYDGRPPLLHQHGCPYWNDGPLFYLPDGTPFYAR